MQHNGAGESGGRKSGGDFRDRIVTNGNQNVPGMPGQLIERDRFGRALLMAGNKFSRASGGLLAAAGNGHDRREQRAQSFRHAACTCDADRGSRHCLWDA